MESNVAATIGLIVLDSDRNVVGQHRMLLPETVRIETEPVELKGGIVTNASLTAMFASNQLEVAARKLAERGAQYLCFCCTSGSLVNGPGWDRVLIERIQSAAGVPASTTATAVMSALHTLGVQTVAIGTPYIEEVNERERTFFERAGFTVAAIEGLGCYTDPEIATVTPEQIESLARRVDLPETDAVFLSCTTLNVAGSIARLENELGKPVVTSNQATAWALLRHLEIAPGPNAFGRLMTIYEETVSI
jgi:maleate isomerase